MCVTYNMLFKTFNVSDVNLIPVFLESVLINEI